MLKLPEYARRMGISRAYAHKLYTEGKLPHPAKKVGPRTILVDVPADFGETPAEKRNVIYARVSNASRTDALNNQKLRLLEYCAENNIKVDEIIIETGSGLNPNRKKLNKLLQDKTIGNIIIEHRDRLTRFNYELIESALKAHDTKIIVIDNTEIEDDIIRDMTEVMVSIMSRFYGKRGATIRAKRAVKEATKPEVDQ